MLRLLILLTLMTSSAVAQSNQPVQLPEYVQQEQKANGASVGLSGEQLTTQPNLLEQLALCNKPAAVIYDSNRSGKPDTLKVYGVSLIPQALWKLRGLQAVASASEKAELKAQGYAVEYLNGVKVAQDKRLITTDKTTSSAATSSASGTDAAAATSLLSEMAETLQTFNSSSAQGFLRQGKMTGTRMVNIAELGMCVVVRYELPLDQSKAAQNAVGTKINGSPSTAAPDSGLGGQGKGGDFGYPELPNGTVGDF